MKKKKTIAVIGATGAVGQEIIRLLLERNFPVQSLRLFASQKSVGQTIHSIKVEPIELLSHVDLAFFAAGSSISKEWIPKMNGISIDSSSAFRKTKPLIIPEINRHTITPEEKIYCSPNCTATVLLMPLFALHRKLKVKRLITSTYQAASGGGAKLVDHLKKETLSYLQGVNIPSLLPYPYAFNLYPHNSNLYEDGYVDEEIKIRDEIRKILDDESIQISATCIRVPVLRAHSVSVNVEFKNPFTLSQIYELLSQVSGIKILEDRINNRFPTPWDATGKSEILCGRFRIDQSQPNTLEFWAVGDQLLKGAALNAVQIAECL